MDLAKEKDRLRHEIEKLEEEVLRLEKKLDNENFVNKAPAAVVDAEREKLESYRRQKEETRVSLENLEELSD